MPSHPAAGYRKCEIARRSLGCDMLDSARLIGFVPTTDIDRAQAFYAGVLGLTLTEVSPYACVFDSGGTMLRVTRGPPAIHSGAAGHQ